MLPRTFLMTFSHTSACAGTSAASTPSRARPPVFSRSLWQVTQYCLTSPAGAGATGATWAARTSANGTEDPVQEPAAAKAAARSVARVTRRYSRPSIVGKSKYGPYRRNLSGHGIEILTWG